MLVKTRGKEGNKNKKKVKANKNLKIPKQDAWNKKKRREEKKR